MINENNLRRHLPKDLRERIEISQGTIILHCDKCKSQFSHTNSNGFVYSKQDEPVKGEFKFQYNSDPLMKAIVSKIGKLPKLTIRCDMQDEEEYLMEEELSIWEENENRYMKILKLLRKSLDELKKKEKLTDEDIEKKEELEKGIKNMREKISIEQERELDSHGEFSPPAEYCLEKNKEDINRVVEAIFKSMGGK